MSKIKNYIFKLYSLDCRIFSEDDIEGDLVKSLKNAPIIHDFLKGMNNPSRYLLVKTILDLTSKEVCEIKNYSFPLGYIEPQDLLDVTSIEDFFKKIRLGYPQKHNDFQFFNLPLDLDKVVQTNDSKSLFAALNGSYSYEKDPLLRFELLKMLNQDFISLGEKISLGRVELIYPYLPDLMQKPNHKRYDLLRAILDRTYPFTEENKYDGDGHDNWASEIKSAES
jgi:hypothetical protein